METVTSNSSMSSALLLVSTVTEVSVAPPVIPLFGVVVEGSSVLTAYVNSVGGFCGLAGAALAE